MDFEQYATARLPTLLGTARAVCGDMSLAEDLVQDVLIKVHRRWPTIESLEARDAYVRRMLVNEFVSWRRKWGRIRPHPETSVIVELRAVPDRRDEADVHAERAALLDDVRLLPTQQRMVIAMRYFADLSDADIADALGCAEGTVRAHASRALAALRVQVGASTVSRPRKDGRAS